MDNPATMPHTPTLRVNGAAARAPFTDQLSGWQLDQALSQPATLTLALNSLADPALKVGDQIDIISNDGLAFSGTVCATAHSRSADGVAQTRFIAQDPLAGLDRAQRLAAHNSGTLKKIVSTLFASHGIAHTGLDQGPELGRIIQWGASDLGWAANICATYGTYFCMQGNRVRFFALGAGSPDFGAPLLDAALNVFDYTLHRHAETARTKTGIFANSFDDLSTLSAENSGHVKGAATQRDIAGGTGVMDKTALKFIADADLARSRLAAEYGQGLAEGNLTLQPGLWVRFEDETAGVKTALQLTETRHTYTPESGLTTSFSSAPPAPPQAPAGLHSAIGTVTNTDDPHNKGRIKVRLDAFNDLETDWLHVAHAGAGAQKGLVIAPEEKDQVLIIFAGNNPAQGFVISGLYGKRAMANAPNTQRRPRPFTLHTAGGQSLTLDDHEKSVELESKGGLLSLHPSLVKLIAKTDLHIEAPGQNIVITAKKIDFKQG